MSANPTIDIRKGEELDITAVDRVLKQAVPELTGQPKVTQYASGASNLTYALDYPDRRLVLRRPPFGTKPKSGHDMFREYRVMTALKPVYPAVPRTLYYTKDPDIIGAEFYVMERVEGHLIHTTIPKDWNWGEVETRKLCLAFFDKLIELHNINYKDIGLSDFGRPDGYVERQILGWNRRYEKALTPDVDAFEGVDTEAAECGLPQLPDAMVTLEGRVESHMDAGDHVIYLVTIMSGKAHQNLEDFNPFVHVRKNGFSY